MLSKDLMKAENNELMQKLSDAVNAKDEAEMQKLMAEFFDGIQQRIIGEAMQFSLSADRSVLAARGIRQLTSEETKYYQAWIEVNKDGNPKQAITGLTDAMPLTIIDSVMEEMRQAHPLLDNIDFINANGAIKLVINAGDVQLATWDALTTAITQELSQGIEVIDLTQAKLSAFIPVSKDMLDLGPSWLDNYVRIILTEALALGLEKAILKGTGKNEPIGMCKDLKGSVQEGVYSDKKKVALSSFEPEAYCGVIGPLAEKPGGKENKGGYRAVPEVLLIVNPKDYITKVSPASTIRTLDGTYKSNVFPYPTKVVMSAALAEGEAIVGIGKRYFMATGSGKSGKLEFSDEYQFLEDNRVYLVKFYGMGRPKDNNSFVYLDISKLAPVPLKVMSVTDAMVSSASVISGISTDKGEKT